MQLSVQEALERGIEAQKAGNVNEADRFYTAILKAKPEHPDANHNMGVLALSIGKVEQGLPFFKTALESNPEPSQYWLSYIGALIKLERLDEAITTLQEAKERCFQDERFEVLTTKVYQLREKKPDTQSIENQKQPNVLDTQSLNQALKLASQKIKIGASDEASQIYQDILIKFPKNKNARLGLKSLSEVNLKRKKLAQNPSEKQLKSLVDMYQNGYLEDASTESENLVEIFPNSAILHNLRGLILHKLGKLNSSIDAFKKAISINKNIPEYYRNMGKAFQDHGDLGEAIKSYEKAISIKNDFAEAYNDIGTVLQIQNKTAEAIQAFKKAIKFKEDFSEAYNNLALCLHSTYELRDALEFCKRANLITPHRIEILNNIANILKDLGDPDEAFKFYEKALSINPNNAVILNNLGNLLKEQNKIEEAKLSFARALDINPRYASAHLHLSSVKNYNKQDPQFISCQTLIKSSNLSNNDRLRLHFALAKMYEDTGDYALAFDNLLAGNALHKRLLGYSIRQDETLFKRLKNTQPELIKYTQPKFDLSDVIMPIFILGMPRSGTTLIEQVLSSHSQVEAAGEVEYARRLGIDLSIGNSLIDSKSILNFRNCYMEEIIKKSNNRRFVTDKMPHNFRLIPLICAALPNVKIIHTHRVPAATCWSNFRHYFPSRELGYSNDLNDINSYYKLYTSLIHDWRQAYSNNIYDLNYDQFTNDQETETRRLLEFLELPWENNCLAPEKNARSVTTASNLQVRKKVYTNSSQTWRRYEQYLNGAFDNLN